MGQARFCESVIKLVAGHMEDAASVEQGCRAFEKLATDQPQNASRLGQVRPAVVVVLNDTNPPILNSHSPYSYS